MVKSQANGTKVIFRNVESLVKNLDVSFVKSPGWPFGRRCFSELPGANKDMSQRLLSAKQATSAGDRNSAINNRISTGRPAKVLGRLTLAMAPNILVKDA